MYAISHLQAESGTWYWGVHFSRQGKRYYRRFYEPKHGGSAAALKAAIAWRDELLAKLEPLTLVAFCQVKRGHNTSGVPGVHFLTSAAQPLGIWQAKLKLNGVGRTKSFSVLKHGYHGAYELAVAAREQILATADDRVYLYDKLAKRAAPKAGSAASKAV
jgi:hypothetical protein